MVLFSTPSFVTDVFHYQLNHQIILFASILKTNWFSAFMFLVVLIRKNYYLKPNFNY